MPVMTDPMELLDVDSALSIEEKEIRRTVARFTAERVRPHLADWLQAGHFPRHLVPRLGKLGLLGMQLTNLPRPAGRQRASASAAFPAADLAQTVRLYSLRNWVEQSDKQVKHELGWADFQVRDDRAIRPHWALEWCAFSFRWRAWFAEHPPPRPRSDQPAADEAAVRRHRPGHHPWPGRRADRSLPPGP